MHSCVRWLQNGTFYEQFQLDALFDVTNNSIGFVFNQIQDALTRVSP